MSFTEGSVIIDVDASTPGLTRVRTRSTRGGEIAQAMAGQRIDSPLPLTLISTLYALCPQAHLGAYKSALAAACGQRDDNAGADRRIVYELMGEHLRFLTFDAPNTVGIASDPEVKKLGALRALLSREFSKPDPDYDSLDKALEPLVEYFVTGCPIERFHALNSLPDFEAWMLRGKTAAARLYAQLWENVPCRRQTPVPMLSPALSLTEINSWFAQGISSNAPAVNGRAYQTSALARHEEHALLAEICEQYSCGVRTQFTARLIDLMQYWLERRLPQNVLRAASPEKGVGLSIVQCARGTLITRVETSDATLDRVQIVAPTEWNFAPGSAAQAVLESIDFQSQSQYRADASWVIAAVDPCVPYQIRFAAAKTPAQS